MLLQNRDLGSDSCCEGRDCILCKTLNMNLETNEHMKNRLVSIFSIFKTAGWVLPKADSETKTWLQTVYLRGHSKRYKWGSEGNRRRGKKPVKHDSMSSLPLWACGSQSHWAFSDDPIHSPEKTAFGHVYFDHYISVFRNKHLTQKPPALVLFYKRQAQLIKFSHNNKVLGRDVWNCWETMSYRWSAHWSMEEYKYY